jgi:hypothetical protein
MTWKKAVRFLVLNRNTRIGAIFKIDACSVMCCFVLMYFVLHVSVVQNKTHVAIPVFMPELFLFGFFKQSINQCKGKKN